MCRDSEHLDYVLYMPMISYLHVFKINKILNIPPELQVLYFTPKRKREKEEKRKRKKERNLLGQNSSLHVQLKVMEIHCMPTICGV